MPMVFTQGFKINSEEAVDSRFILTKAEMAALFLGEMPEYYFCMCKDDGKFYVYDGVHSTGAHGEFKPYEECIDLPEAIEAAIESSLADLNAAFSKVIPGALKMALEDQTKDSGLVVDSDGNIALNYNEDLLTLSENKLDLNIELIQAI